MILLPRFSRDNLAYVTEAEDVSVCIIDFDTGLFDECVKTPRSPFKSPYGIELFYY